MENNFREMVVALSVTIVDPWDLSDVCDAYGLENNDFEGLARLLVELSQVESWVYPAAVDTLRMYDTDYVVNVTENANWKKEDVEKLLKVLNA